MSNSIVEEGIIEAYKHKFVQDRGAGLIKKVESECVLFCKKVTPNIFDIKNGFAVVSGADEIFKDRICMISSFKKVVFVFDQQATESQRIFKSRLGQGW